MSNKFNIIEKLIEEAFGGANGGGSGTFSWASQTGAKTWAPKSPAARGTTTTPTPDELTGIIQQEEEEAQQAPPRKPYPLETIDDSLVQAFVQLGISESLLKTCIKYNAVITSKKEKKKVLEFLADKVSAIRQMIKSVSEELDRINIS